MLRPGYNPPNRKDISGPLLDQVHDKLKTKMKYEIQGKNVVLVQDGWSDIHNTPVIASSIHCDIDGSSYFLSAVNTGTKKCTILYKCGSS